MTMIEDSGEPLHYITVISISTFAEVRWGLQLYR